MNGALADQGAQLYNNVHHAVDVLLLFAAYAQQQRIGARFLDHVHDLAAADGQGPEGHVLHHFNIDAPEAEHDNRAEGGVAAGADNGLDLLFQHLGYFNALYVGLGVIGPAALHDRLIGVDDFVAVIKIKGHAAGIALVHNVLGHDFHHDRIAAFFSAGNGLVEIAGNITFRHRYPDEVHNLAALHGQEESSGPV